jgi:protein arginine N-methyltransferase 1
VTDTVFTSYDIQACLYDEDRSRLFRDAIHKTVRPGQIVVDAGSGSGLLGLFAARAGAAKVYCLEINQEYVETIRVNALRNKLQDIVEAVHADATTYEPPDGVQFDVIISEVISAGFFYEPQLQILNNLNRFLKRDGAVVPMAMRNEVELIHAQSDLYGLTFSYDPRFRTLAGDRALSSPRQYLATDFAQPAPTSIDTTVKVTSQSAEAANAVRISYSIQFGPEYWVNTPTEFLMNPQIIFLRDPILLAEGEEYDVRLNYQAGCSAVDCELTVAKTPA